MTAGPDRAEAGARPVPPPPPGRRAVSADISAGTATSGPGGPPSEASSSGGPGEAGPTAERPYGRPVPTEGWGWFARVPLRARLVAITVLLLAAGLGLASAVTTTVVSSYLVGQVDSQLERSAEDVASSTIRQTPAAATSLPSDYYVLVRYLDGNSSALGWPQTTSRYGTPDIPAMSNPEVADAVGTQFTVGSVGGTDPAEWRVTPFFFYDRFSGELRGTAFVALPLTGIHETVKVLGRALALSALGIALVGGAVAYLAVHRALRPLREIEETAADIAAGDLSRRVRPAPPTTEVGSLAASLNAMLTQIEEAFAVQEASEERMRRFVSDASHELRTPLATIRGYGELYRMGALDTPDKVDDTMGRIEDSATRMGTLVNDLLALARLDEGRPLRHEPVDLVSLARDSAQDLHALDPTRDVRLVGLGSGAKAPAALRVVGDEDRLRQVLANLVGNVARHTPAGTPVEIALGVVRPATPPDDAPGGPGDEVAVLEVRDHGPGVPGEQRGRVFERFYRADSSRNRASGGSGLGLAIVAAIVGAHQGRVSVRETTGGGLTVRVDLPLAP
ncbi:two-component sensor histidine kinase [Cellulosimicrobium cellulans]|uniref:histidine kinase n=1 Tax=Cellulosimicrobium cellulans TaxID=1710 RepID=A0A1Y0HU00_CELCE|nr:HAMP domain-containing sensor histidine kinase [Cellulosimicrobium cellulans]ARU50744.1 two-component sensor histidine kinase [Cellulosimicrobium cellulans]